MTSPVQDVYESMLSSAYPNATAVQLADAAKYLIDHVRSEGHIEDADTAREIGKELETRLSGEHGQEAKPADAPRLASNSC